MRQVAIGGGAVGLVGGMPGARAQEVEVDFSVLAEHDPLQLPMEEMDTVFRSEPGVARRARAQEESGEARTDEAVAGTGGESGAEPAAAEVAELVENRALWIDLGYLILIQWRRPEDDEAAIAALEGATPAVSAFLQERVTDPYGQLHDASRLRELELGLVALLQSVVGDRTLITVTHIDHDCTQTACVSDEVDSPPHVRGRVAPPYPY